MLMKFLSIYSRKSTNTYLTLTQSILLLLFVTLTVSKAPKEMKNDSPEAGILKTKNKFLQVVRDKHNWGHRLLEVVKMELHDRQTVEKCKSIDIDCLYTIRWVVPESGVARFRRSATKVLSKESTNKKYPDKTDKHKEIQDAKQLANPDSTPLWKESPGGNGSPLQRSSDRPMTECEGDYQHYCLNGAQCVYVGLLKEAVCICRKGFSGDRCLRYSLPSAIETFKKYDEMPVDVQSLSQPENELLDSVMDATARFTFDTVQKNGETVKGILDAAV